MPIYEYQCAACGRIVEKWQKFSEEPLTMCSHCGGSLSKIISSCAFHLKGSGWYVTDYAGSHSASGKPEKAEGTPGTEGTQGSEGSKTAGSSDSTPPPKIS
jgi:putative FmdB family regulatory protein